MEKRQARSRAHHSRHSQERRSKRQSSLGIAAHGFIVRRPFREFCPALLECGKNAEKGNGSRRQEEHKALEIVARVAMSIFVQQCHLQLLQGKGAEQGIGNDQAWTKKADQRKERCVFVDDYSRRGFLEQNRAACILPRAAEANGSGEGAPDSREGAKPACCSQHAREHAYAEQKMSRGARAHRFRHSNDRARRQTRRQTCGCIHYEERSEAETQQSQRIRNDHGWPRRKSSRRFLRIFFSSSSRSAVSCSPTASRKEESSSSREAWGPVKKFVRTFSARVRSHSCWENRAE